MQVPKELIQKPAIMHALNKLEQRKLDMVIHDYLPNTPGMDRHSQLASLTDAIKMCVMTMGALKDTLSGDPAWRRLYEDVSAVRKAANWLACGLTENTRDLAILIDADRAARYSLGAHNRQSDKLKYARDLAEICHCEFILNLHVGLPWNRHSCWLIPSPDTDMTMLTDFLRSENIPFDYEAKSLLEAVGAW